MLIWLASYPRSGNSLLRQVLWHTMGIASYHETGAETPAEYGRLVGAEFADLDELRATAATSSEPYLVKTHSPPVDDSPAIYVVRDGRAAVTSFLKYERTFSPESDPTLLRLILGDHFYGGWSQHYDAWHVPGSRPLLTLRYEHLLAADEATVRRIADFVGHEGAVEPFTNPIAYWRERASDVVGQGKVDWDPPEEWTPVADAAFWQIHGALMRDLAYDDGRRREPPSVQIHELVEVAAGAIEARRASAAAAAEKEAVIQAIARERDLQARIASERLAALNALQREYDALTETAAAHEEQLRALALAHERERDELRRVAEQRAASEADR